MNDHTSSSSLPAKWAMGAPYLLSALRIVAAIMFITNGTMKLFGWPIPMPPDQPPVLLLSEVGIGGSLEFVGGILLLIGLWTRPVAFILAGEMAVAYFQFHLPGGLKMGPQGFWPMVNGGTDAVLYCFLWLYYSAAGAGVWSLDAMRR